MTKTTFQTNFLTAEKTRQLVKKYGSPLYVYSKTVLKSQAQKILALPAPYGLTVRYAMKANPHAEILQIFKKEGIKIDASSEYEAVKALEQGFTPHDILLTSQQLPKNLRRLVQQGIQFNACSLHQLEQYGKLFPGKKVSIRFNPGMGSGHSQKTNVGGVTSGFGIWHEYIPKVKKMLQAYNLEPERIHTHIGSGTDMKLWAQAINLSFDLAEKFPSAGIINIGGGFKVGRMDNEPSTDIKAVGTILKKKLKNFATKNLRKLHLEVEPGTFLVANAGIIVAQIEDIVDTGKKGYRFIKLNTGMTELLRPTLYAAQHPIIIQSKEKKTDDFVIIGHCCESGDLLTPNKNDPEKLATRRLPEPHIGDNVLIGGCGAYSASMAAHGYNSFPRAQEVFIQ